MPHPCTASPTITTPHQRGTCVTINELTRMCHYPETTVTLSFPLNAVHSVVWGKCLRMHIHHYRVLQNGLTALKLLCAPPAQPSLPLNPWQPLIFSSSIVLSFRECHTVGITHDVALSDWLLSLSDMHLRFLCVFSWFDSSFLFSVDNTPLSQFIIHSPAEGHLGYFQVLATVNKAAINIHVQVSVWT